MKKILITFLGLAGIAALFITFKVQAANITKVVTPADMATSFADLSSKQDAWFFYNDETDQIDNSLGTFVTGPATPPAGNDSVQISVTGTQRRNLATYQFSGTPLSNITELKFSTYNPSAGNGGSANRSGYLNFNVDFNGSDTWQRRLVYVPSQNETVVQDSWQEWDAINGGNALWSYSGTTWPATTQGPDANLSESGTTLRSWNDILADYPGIRIRLTDSWLGIRVGEPYADGYTENIDAFKFGTNEGTTTFDFEKAFPVLGEITNPATDGTHVSGVVDFTATYTDEGPDVDPVQWAIRQGTCAASTGTVLGNVDGHTDTASWDGNNFSFSTDTSSLTPGEYCFVFNPTDDPGQTDVRVTRNFVVDAVENPLIPAECAGMDLNGKVIIGSSKSETLNGTSKNDLILGRGGSDTINGGNGDDCIVSGNGSDVIHGNNGNDIILGGGGSDAIYGDNGDDTLYGQGGADSLYGGTGKDMLNGGAAYDSAHGDNGQDTCVAESKNSCEL